MRLIQDAEDVTEALATLLASDPRLAPVLEVAGQVPLRRRQGGFAGLARIITAQQISDAAADAIWTRLTTAVDPLTPQALLSAGEDTLKAAGLSRPKIRTLTGIAAACSNGFDPDRLHTLPPDEAIAEMVALHGVGRWTAEIYLLFCCGHPDIFPAGDLALQSAVAMAFDRADRPGEKELRAIAETWSPWRAVAARLFWAYYRARRKAPLDAARAPL
ncbi:MAG TPA: DNA-3-methyladenine glycosylase [Afifellaceae bacterium]|nr:DNA-3-methyladenine glycosylase [Afifellaceae bacterium]